ncbi:MAG: SPFH domain-containing protein [Parcubacteria group bacterium]|nr:SPFH domain-containing protein [Parcubacteria group bacterium]
MKVYPWISIPIAIFLYSLGLFWGYQSLSFIQFAGLAAILIGSFFLGFNELPVSTKEKYEGILSVLGKEMPHIVLSSGWHHTTLPYPLISVIKANVQKRTTNDDITSFSKDDIEVTAKSKIVWRVKNIFVFIKQGEDDIEDALKSIMKNSIRTSIKERTARECKQSNSDLQDELQEKIDAEEKSFGIDVEKIYVEDIDVDENFKNAMREKRIREEIRDAEKISIDHMKERAKEIVIESEGRITEAEAYEIVQIERGKIPKNIQEYEIGKRLQKSLSDNIIGELIQSLKGDKK